MTSHIQPMDAGIIRTFKAHYRRLYIMRALERNEEDYREIYHINQLEAMLMSQEAWSSVTATTIANCWHHSGILSTDEPTHPVGTHSTNPTAIASTILQPAGVFSAIQDLEAALLQLNMTAVLPKNRPGVEELLSIEGEKITEEEWTDEDIVEQTRIDVIEAGDGVVEGLDEPGEEEDPLLSLPAACRAISELLRLCNT